MSVNQPDPRDHRVAGVYEVRWRAGARPEREEAPTWTCEIRNPDTTLLHHDWTWCQVCQRVWRTQRWVHRRWRCPTRGCGGRMLNAFPWEDLMFGPRSRHPGYPLRPGDGDWYPYF